jgi:hypothetical protein
MRHCPCADAFYLGRAAMTAGSTVGEVKKSTDNAGAGMIEQSECV